MRTNPPFQNLPYEPFAAFAANAPHHLRCEADDLNYQETGTLRNYVLSVN